MQFALPEDDGKASQEECQALIGKRVQVEGSWFGEDWAIEHSASHKKFFGTVVRVIDRQKKKKTQHGVVLVFDEDKFEVNMFYMSGVRALLIQ